MRKFFFSLLAVVVFFSAVVPAMAQGDDFVERIDLCATMNGGSHKGSLTIDGEAKSVIEFDSHFEVWTVNDSGVSNSGLYEDCLGDSVAVIQSIEAQSAYLTPSSYFEAWIIVANEVFAASGLGSSTGDFVEYNAVFYIEGDHFSIRSVSDLDNPTVMVVGEHFEDMFDVITNVNMSVSSYMVFCIGGHTVWQMTKGQEGKISLTFIKMECNHTGIYMSPIAGAFGENFTQYDNSVSIIFPN